jgi:hypothetical protein
VLNENKNASSQKTLRQMNEQEKEEWTTNFYRNFEAIYAEEAPARLAAVLSKDNPYLPYMGEARRLDLEAQLRDMSPNPAINLPVVVESPHPQIIKPKPTSITEIYDKPPYHIIRHASVMASVIRFSDVPLSR